MKIVTIAVILLVMLLIAIIITLTTRWWYKKSVQHHHAMDSFGTTNSSFGYKEPYDTGAHRHMHKYESRKSIMDRVKEFFGIASGKLFMCPAA